MHDNTKAAAIRLAGCTNNGSFCIVGVLLAAQRQSAVNVLSALPMWEISLNIPNATPAVSLVFVLSSAGASVSWL
jgi:hypothetical protein